MTPSCSGTLRRLPRRARQLSSVLAARDARGRGLGGGQTSSSYKGGEAELLAFVSRAVDREAVVTANSS